MSNRNYDLKVFLIKCDQLIFSKYILADAKITELLNSIAQSEIIYEFFTKLLENFNYNTFKAECFLQSSNLENRFTLVLPKDANDKVAFIFCLLIEINNKQLDLHKFLQEFFYEDGSFYESYQAFCNQVLIPFRNIVKALIENSTEDKDDSAKTFVDKWHGENYKKISQLITGERDLVLAYKNLNDEEKGEIIEVLDGFEAACLTFDKDLMQLLFLAYKFAIKSIDNFKGNFKEIENLVDGVKKSKY